MSTASRAKKPETSIFQGIGQGFGSKMPRAETTCREAKNLEFAESIARRVAVSLNADRFTQSAAMQRTAAAHARPVPGAQGARPMPAAPSRNASGPGGSVSTFQGEQFNPVAIAQMDAICRRVACSLNADNRA